jgi:hypothetical protein
MTAPTPTARLVNVRLAELLREAGYSRKGFARAVRETSARLGWPVACNHVAVSRWLQGVTPRPATIDVIALVLGQTLGRAVTADELGLTPPGLLVPGQRRPTAAEHETAALRRRLDWLVAETARLSESLAHTTGARPALVGLVASISGGGPP